MRLAQGKTRKLISRFTGCAPRASWPETGMWEITIEKSASIRQPHWRRHLDVKRPTHHLGGPGHKDGTPTIRPSDGAGVHNDIRTRYENALYRSLSNVAHRFPEEQFGIMP